MAKQERITVELSAKDRLLLQQIRDAIRDIGIEDEDQAAAQAGVKRLMEHPTVFADE